jgi:ribosomal protein S17E
MPRTYVISASKELIEQYNQRFSNGNKPVAAEILEKYNLSRNDWQCFEEMVEELELNSEGARILLEEILTGRVILPCR